MKLHYNSEPSALATARKLKSVIESTGSKVEEVAYKLGDDISQISSIGTLPLLETPQGTFFSSNTIIRYLATVNKSELYGNGNVHNQALVDQWLDITTCDFEPAVRGISKQVNGEKVDFTKLIADINNFLAFVEKHIAGKKYLVADSLTIADLSVASSISVAFQFLIGEGPRKKFPNTVAWYTLVATANKIVGPVELPKDSHEAFRGGKKVADKPAKEAKEPKEPKGKKEQSKEQKKTDEDDLFGDETTPVVPKPVVQPKPKKEKPLAKSIVVFDVKVYEQETDLQQLFNKVRALTIDGLVWNSEPKFVDIAYGMKKLQVGCVVEDAKVSLEDLYELIEGWEEVQSTDTVSFQKL